MSGIYIHIPFCKQACHYGDFHFSTSMKKKDDMVLALAKEIRMGKSEVSEVVETIYFGGGTSSVLTNAEIQVLIDVVFENFEVVDHAEISKNSKLGHGGWTFRPNCHNRIRTQENKNDNNRKRKCFKKASSQNAATTFRIENLAYKSRFSRWIGGSGLSLF